MRPWRCGQQFHQKINNSLLVFRASYPSRLDFSCRIPVSCNKYWHVTHLCNSFQVYLVTVFVPRFHAISRSHCIMNKMSYCSWRIRSNVTRVMWIHLGSSNSMQKSVLVRSVLGSLFSVIIGGRFRKSSETLKWFYRFTYRINIKKECSQWPSSQLQSAGLYWLFETPTYVRIALFYCVAWRTRFIDVLDSYKIVFQLCKKQNTFNFWYFLVVTLLRFVHISFVLLFTTTGRISVKFYIGSFYKDLLINCTNVSNLIKISVTLHCKVKYFMLFLLLPSA
jgi:hypothetical protein